jgi:hypothetical protein
LVAGDLEFTGAVELPDQRQAGQRDIFIVDGLVSRCRITLSASRNQIA